MECLDNKGIKLAEGDIVEVTVKYLIIKVYDDGHVLAQKVYDVPASALTKTSENLEDEAIARVGRKLDDQEL